MVKKLIDDFTKNEILELSKEFKKRRIQLGISQLKFSKIANLSQSIINKLENGKIDPTLSTIIKIESALYEHEKIANLKACDIMVKEIFSINSECMLYEAIEIMIKNDFSQLLVFEKDVAIGTIYEKTILNLISQKFDIYSTKIKKYVDTLPISIPYDFNILDLKYIFKNRRAKFVIVRGKINENKEFEDVISGIITHSDLYKN